MDIFNNKMYKNLEFKPSFFYEVIIPKNNEKFQLVNMYLLRTIKVVIKNKLRQSGRKVIRNL